MAASAKRHMPLLLFIAVVVCMSGKMSRALEPPAGKTVACGGYTYLLPEGFHALSLHREFDEYISIADIFNTPPDRQASSVACITVANRTGSNFIVDEIKALIKSSDALKSRNFIRPRRYEAELPEAIRLYAFYELYSSATEMDFSVYMIELKATDNKHNMFLYIRDRAFLLPKKDSTPTWEEEYAYHNMLKKERAMQLINSVRRQNE